MVDLGRRKEMDGNWNTSVFLTYAIGGKKGKVIDVALEKNNPIVFPTSIVRGEVCKDFYPYYNSWAIIGNDFTGRESTTAIRRILPPCGFVPIINNDH